MFGWLDKLWDKITSTIDSAFANICVSLYNSIFTDMRDQLFKVSDSASQTPTDFGNQFINTSAGIYNGKNLNDIIELIIDNAIMPIAIVILSFFIMYEFITMVMDKNNMKEFDTSIFIRWIMKSVICLYLMLNTTTIVNGIFTIGSFIVKKFEDINPGIMGDVTFVAANFEGNGIGYATLIILGVLLKICIIGITICAYVAILNRLLEVLIYMSVAPIPFATFANQEFGSIGKNYIKALMALALQGFFIVFIVAVYQFMIITQLQKIEPGTSAITSGFTFDIVMCIIYSIVLATMLFKTSSISKSIMNAA